MADDHTSDTRLSIGAVEEATGIPAATLRTWERRYGFPDPSRTESGHRRYAPSVIRRLRMIDRALDCGCRASDVVDLSAAELERIVGDADRSVDSASEGASDSAGEAAAEPDSGASTSSGAAGGGSWLEEWMRAVRKFDGAALTAAFRSAWNERGGLEFLRERLAPFVERIGREWERGDLDVAREHYASEMLRDFLSSRWRPLSERASGPVAVCATVSGEQHVLGVHVAAVVLAMADWRTVFLGSGTPRDDLVDAARTHGAAAVAVSFTAHWEPDAVRRALASLREALPADIELVAGGAGSPAPGDGPEGVRSFANLENFYSWAFDRAAPPSGRED